MWWNAVKRTERHRCDFCLLFQKSTAEIVHTVDLKGISICLEEIGIESRVTTGSTLPFRSSFSRAANNMLLFFWVNLESFQFGLYSPKSLSCSNKHSAILCMQFPIKWHCLLDSTWNMPTLSNYTDPNSHEIWHMLTSPKDQERRTFFLCFLRKSYW